MRLPFVFCRARRIRISSITRVVFLIAELSARELHLHRVRAPRAGARADPPRPADVAFRQDHGALDRVLELAHVARPRVLVEQPSRLGVDAADVRAQARVVAREEVIDEERHVFAALAERGIMNGEDVDAIEEVLAKAPGLGLGREIAVRRGDDADVDLDVARLAEPPDRLLLEHAQELHLQPERQLADLVEEERAAVGFLEEPSAVAARRR